MNKKIIILTFLPLLFLSFLTYEYFEEEKENSKVVEEGTSFIQEGVLIKNNPGLEEEVWYLSYEKAGNPGLKIKLKFDKESDCIIEKEVDCLNLSEELIGTKVQIEGSEKNNQVLVYLLKKKVEKSENVQDIARNWIKNNSPTYNYDGEKLTFIEERGLDLVDCENCYEIEYSFQSRHSGYGNREGENLAQVITNHNIVVLVKDGEVNRVVTDQKYDEINQELLEK